jgi:WD40 repeat protein
MKKLMHSFNAKTFVFLLALLFSAFAGKAQNVTQLTKGSELTIGNSIFSPDGKYKMTLESNGNMVIYNNNTQVWQSNTAGQGVTKCSFQADGNLVLYTATNVAKWAAGLNNTSAATLMLLNDGNLGIFTSGSVKLWDRISSGSPTNPLEGNPAYIRTNPAPPPHSDTNIEY